MKLHDSVIGGLLICFGLWVVWTSSSFPKLTGQPIGPGTFPVILGVATVLGGIGIGVQGLRNGGPLMQLASGWRSAERIASAMVLIIGTALLAMNFETIGFPIGGSILLIALFATSGKRHPVWIGLAVGFIFMLHILLSGVLQVPLPAGPLKGLI
ncbi:tripartite tricarboxylate transporter TctB family protein [Roseinatronobacter alkalisoli]|uniref:Tripartite tricarboxylate transporter TctB family protein n=1 Tax=Roseinatronobacter alkalisoli TaxID=3028235 RepID=A0ABT5TAQ5_9RHOB|nr:tripartite tricarboxylate transporter TctB family protein [Roseinatronobacter sp. HJB301]MDD7971013.1 tripartite tricarboxylate transporter TctB family protein [Roseinatronobacter sp. HJB301]